jgi:hypothetical protein
MANYTYKTLGQLFPADTSEHALYTVPAATQTVTSSLMVCNQYGTPQSFSVAVKPGGGALAAQNYIYYNIIVPPNNSLDLSNALTLAAGDVVSVICGAASTLSFSLFGTEYA